MILQTQRSRLADAILQRAAGDAFDRHVILHQDAVVENGESARRRDRAVCPTSWGVEDNVVGLPLFR